jgi:hypothetical protein
MSRVGGTADAEQSEHETLKVGQPTCIKQQLVGRAQDNEQWRSTQQISFSELNMKNFSMPIC